MPCPGTSHASFIELKPLRGGFSIFSWPRQRLACASVLISVLTVPLLRAQSLDHGVNATNLGKGDWIYQMSDCQSALGVGSPQAVFDYEVTKGVQWVAVKGADGTNTNSWTQFNSALVSQAHAVGLKIFVSAYAYGNEAGTSSVQGEINAALALLGQGADGFIIDAEYEYETNATRVADAATYCQAIKAAYPNTFLAHMPFPDISGHSNFPYAVFGYYCDAVMPQDYWGTLLRSSSQMVSDMDTQWNDWQNSLTGTNLSAIKPIAPIGQGYNYTGYSETTAEITNFINLLKIDPGPAGVGGYNGVSFWTCQSHTTADWAAIAASTIGSPVIASPPIINCQFNGSGQLILGLQGPSGRNFTIYSSTDLENWVVVTNLANPGGTNQFMDNNVRNNTRKFYRAALSY